MVAVPDRGRPVVAIHRPSGENVGARYMPGVPSAREERPLAVAQLDPDRRLRLARVEDEAPRAEAENAA